MKMGLNGSLDRGALGGLVVVLLLAAAPHGSHLPLWVILTTGLFGAWRMGLLLTNRRMPTRWVLIPVALLVCAGVVLSYRTLFGREAGVALLVLMLGIKLLEVKTRRDVTVVIFLAYFLIVTNFFYSQTIPTAIFMLVLVWSLTAIMLAFQYVASPPSWPSITRSSATLLLQGIPVMLVLFVLFPRIQGPLWGLPQSTFSGSSGLSDSMSPGSLSELSLSDAVAFRVQFEQLPDKPSRLYWRGPILWDFDGRTWSTGASGRSLLPPDMQALTQPLKYTVTLEPHHQRWMFGMDLPVTVPADATLNHDYQLLSKQPITSRVRYDLASVAGYRLDSALSAADRQRALRVPFESNPRAVTLARSWLEKSPDPHAIVAQALVFFRTQPFFYTLVPPLLGAQPVDEFLYETRRGFCEHYASSFVFLMRAAGIPARVVTGYLGGEINSLGDYMIVRQSDAHAWAEVWLPDEGWLRIDPTAAVSPARIEVGIAAALPAGEPLPMLVRLDLEWLRDARFAWDALANSWNQWVLGYTPDRQSRLLQSMGLARTSWQDLVIALMTCCILVVSVLAAVTLRNRRKEQFDPARRHWERFCRAMGRRGMPRLAYEGPISYGLRLQTKFPEQASDLHKITRLYARLRYGPPTAHRELAELQARVARL